MNLLLFFNYSSQRAIKSFMHALALPPTASLISRALLLDPRMNVLTVAHTTMGRRLLCAARARGKIGSLARVL